MIDFTDQAVRLAYLDQCLVELKKVMTEVETQVRYPAKAHSIFQNIISCLKHGPDALAEDEIYELNLILKGSYNGSGTLLESIRQKIAHPKPSESIPAV